MPGLAAKVLVGRIMKLKSVVWYSGEINRPRTIERLMFGTKNETRQNVQPKTEEYMQNGGIVLSLKRKRSLNEGSQR